MLLFLLKWRGWLYLLKVSLHFSFNESACFFRGGFFVPLDDHRGEWIRLLLLLLRLIRCRIHLSLDVHFSLDKRLIHAVVWSEHIVDRSFSLVVLLIYYADCLHAGHIVEHEHFTFGHGRGLQSSMLGGSFVQGRVNQHRCFLSVINVTIRTRARYLLFTLDKLLILAGAMCGGCLFLRSRIEQRLWGSFVHWHSHPLHLLMILLLGSRLIQVFVGGYFLNLWFWAINIVFVIGTVALFMLAQWKILDQDGPLASRSARS